MTHVARTLLQRETSSAMEGTGEGTDNGDSDDLSADPDMIRIQNIMETEGETRVCCRYHCVLQYSVD